MTTPRTKVQVGFFSFTEVTDPSEHRSYNEWHQLDHMPEQFPLPGVVYGQRWVSTPACRAGRTASEPLLDPIHYVTLYLLADPVEETLREFRQLGKDLYAAGRFHQHRHAHLSGPFERRAAAAAERVLISAEAVPYRPHHGIHVVVRDGEPADDVEELCAKPGVAGAWSFSDDTRSVTVAWLDDDPLAVAPHLPSSEPGVVFAGPFETITPWQWDWFDSQ
jgi:hypothetical protein